MDIALLTAFLSPFLPHLLKLGSQAAEKTTEVIAEQFGEATWLRAQKIWQALEPKIEQSEDLKQATAQAAAKPDSTARQAVFQEELETVLKADPAVLEAIAQIMAETPSDTGAQVHQSIGRVEGQVIGQVTGGQNIGQINADKVIGTVSGNVEGGINL